MRGRRRHRFISRRFLQANPKISSWKRMTSCSFLTVRAKPRCKEWRRFCKLQLEQRSIAFSSPVLPQIVSRLLYETIVHRDSETGVADFAGARGPLAHT